MWHVEFILPQTSFAAFQVSTEWGHYDNADTKLERKSAKMSNET